MFARLTSAWPPHLVKWGAYGLLLLAPGSFVALPILWLIKRYGLERRSA